MDLKVNFDSIPRGFCGAESPGNMNNALQGANSGFAGGVTRSGLGKSASPLHFFSAQVAAQPRQ
jgi:hypothetical protein